LIRENGPMIGQTISQYKILEKLGEGGMGVVYKAEDTKLRRTVALKFLPPALLRSPEDRQRFVHEAQATASLSHANVATIFEINESKDSPFIALEYIAGQSLAEKVTSGPLKLEDSVSFAIQLSEGLQAAHDKGIVHRDIKSQNIMVTPAGQVKILDFGLSKLRGASILTKVGTTLGTISYMSPEQLRGEVVDHRTDIWAIGVVMFEMITGRKPFAGEYEEAVAYQVLNQTQVLLSTLRDGVPIHVERIVEKLLSKEAGKRYQNVAELLVDLRTVQKSLESGTASLSVTSALLFRLRRHKRFAAITGAVVVIGLAAITLLVLKPFDSSHQIRSIAILPLRSAFQGADQDMFSDGMQAALINAFGKIQSLTVLARQSVLRFKNSDKSIREIAGTLGVDAVLDGTVLKDSNTIRISVQLIDGKSDRTIWTDQYDREYRNILALHNEIARDVANAVKANVTLEESRRLTPGRPVDPRAYDAYLRGLSLADKSTRESIKKGREYFKQAIEFDPLFAPAYARFALTSLDVGSWIATTDSVGSKAAVAEGLAAVRKALEIDSTSSEAHWTMASYMQRIHWNLKDAEKEYRDAIRLTPGDAGARGKFARLLSILKRHDEALDQARRAEELEPLRPGRCREVANALWYAGRTDDALEKAKKAIEMDEANLQSWLFIGHIYFSKGLMREAMLAWARGQELDGNSELAKAYRELPYKQGLQKWLDQASGPHAPIFGTPTTAALVYELMGNRSEAVRWLEKALAVRDPALLDLLAMPDWAKALSDPRVLSIIQRMGLEEYVKK
jgi:eukaryotic-like serine/threonine-protein kinase